MPKLEWEDLISEHEGESGNHSQSDINKSYKIEEERKFEFSDESLSESVAVTFMVGNYSYYDIQSDQDADHIQEPRDASSLHKKKLEAC